jgi:hypothetical protein
MEEESIVMEDGSVHVMRENDSVECHVHCVKTTWGVLTPIQQLAVTSGLDTTDDLDCLLSKENAR